MVLQRVRIHGDLRLDRAAVTAVLGEGFSLVDSGGAEVHVVCDPATQLAERTDAPVLVLHQRAPTPADVVAELSHGASRVLVTPTVAELGAHVRHLARRRMLTRQLTAA